MNILIKQPMFWITTGLFVIISAGLLVYVMPDLLNRYTNFRAQNSDLQTQIADKESYLNQVKTLKNDKDNVEKYYEIAQKALPTSASSDTLLLQIEALTNSLGLGGVTITVPFNQVAASPTSSSSDTVSTGGAANSTPGTVVKSSSTQTTFTVAGEMGFDSFRTLVSRLRTFARWNRVTTIDLTLSGGEYAASVTAQVFWKNTAQAAFSGSTSFLSSAKTLFDPLQSYSTTPDIQKEGDYGRPDPFATP